VFSVSGVTRPDVRPIGAVNKGLGRDGRHTETFGKLLAEMQVVARAHPMGQW
jgi:ring-1,2-phenylacetyl-CoA epoxidase subunit PaaC